MLWRATIAEVKTMEERCPNTWAFGDDVQSFSHYTQQLFDLWPQKLVIGSIIGTICQFFYIEPAILTTWLFALVLDFALGVAVGIKNDRRLDRVKWQKGVIKIFSYILFLGIIAECSKSFNISSVALFGVSVPWMIILMSAMTITEFSSIARNLELLGFRMPPEVKLLLRVMSKRSRQHLINTEGSTKNESKDSEDSDLK